MLVENGTTILKFYLHISKDEQKKRFEDRLNRADKHWKFSDADLREREYWDEYMKAFEMVLNKCNTKIAPWHIVPANNKWYRDLVIGQTVVKALEGLNMKYPEPERDFSISRQRAYRYSLLVAEGKTDYTEAEQALRMSVTGPEHILSFRPDYPRLVDQAQGKPSDEVLSKLEELEKDAVRISKASHEIILPGQSQIWEFQIQTNIVEEINKKPIYLRFKFNADDEYDPKSHTLWFAVGEGTNKRWPPEGAFKEMNRGSSAFHEEQLPIGIVPDKGPQNGLVRVHFMNRNSERPIIFLMEDGPMILYHDGGFGMNLYRGLLLIYFWLGLISAIGLMASSFLSFPVATFMSLGILLISASTGTLEQIIEEGGITGINHETGKKDESSMLDGAAIFFAKGAVKITTSIWGYSPVNSLSDGRTIKWTTLLSAFVWIVLIMSGLVMAVGVYMFHRKELALPNPTASMN